MTLYVTPSAPWPPEGFPQKPEYRVLRKSLHPMGINNLYVYRRNQPGLVLSRIMKRNNSFWQNEEFRLYLLIALSSVALIFNLILSKPWGVEAQPDCCFQAISSYYHRLQLQTIISGGIFPNILILLIPGAPVYGGHQGGTVVNTDETYGS